MSSNPIKVEWKDYIDYIELMAIDIKKILATTNIRQLERLQKELQGHLIIPEETVWSPNHLWKLWGEPRGGLIPAVMLSHFLKLDIRLDRPVGRCIFVDDILDTGLTFQGACFSGMSVKSLGAFIFYRDLGQTLYRPIYFSQRIGPNDGKVVFPYEDLNEI